MGTLIFEISVFVKSFCRDQKIVSSGEDIWGNRFLYDLGSAPE